MVQLWGRDEVARLGAVPPLVLRVVVVRRPWVRHVVAERDAVPVWPRVRALVRLVVQAPVVEIWAELPQASVDYGARPRGDLLPGDFPVEFRPPDDSQREHVRV